MAEDTTNTKVVAILKDAGSIDDINQAIGVNLDNAARSGVLAATGSMFRPVARDILRSTDTQQAAVAMAFTCMTCVVQVFNAHVMIAKDETAPVPGREISANVAVQLLAVVAHAVAMLDTLLADVPPTHPLRADLRTLRDDMEAEVRELAPVIAAAVRAAEGCADDDADEFVPPGHPVH